MWPLCSQKSDSSRFALIGHIHNNWLALLRGNTPTPNQCFFRSKNMFPRTTRAATFLTNMQIPHGVQSSFLTYVSCPILKCVSQYLEEYGSPLEWGRFMVIPSIHRENQNNQHFSPKILNLNFESDCMVVHKRGRKVGKLGKE